MEQTNQLRLARLLTEIFAPSPVGVVAIVFVAWHYSDTHGAALKWAGLAILFVAVVPFAFIVGQVLRGRVTDIHVRQREQRRPIILLSLCSWLIAIAALYRLGAPHQLVAAIVTGVVALVIFGAITYWWQISFHVSTLAGVLTVFLLIFGRSVLPLYLLVPLVAWARIALRAHTLAQTLAGAVIGAIISGGVYPIIASLIR